MTILNHIRHKKYRDGTGKRIAKNIILCIILVSDHLRKGGWPLYPSYLTGFELRQEMRRDDFEIFYRCDTAPSRITLHDHGICLIHHALEFLVYLSEMHIGH